MIRYLVACDPNTGWKVSFTPDGDDVVVGLHRGDEEQPAHEARISKRTLQIIATETCRSPDANLIPPPK